MKATHSHMTKECLEIFSNQIKQFRVNTRMSQKELSLRVGVSVSTIGKIERADPKVAIGTYFECASIVRLPLYDFDPNSREVYRFGNLYKDIIKLLPKRVQQRRKVSNDF